MTNQPVKAIAWLGNRVRILDQTRLPHEETYLELDDYRDIAAAIVELKIRGAPAIGIAGAYAVALGALQIKSGTIDAFRQQLRQVINAIAATRPTARNLFYNIERMVPLATAGQDSQAITQALIAEAMSIEREEAAASRRMSHYGAELIADSWAILTHCNTGALATAGEGTALGVIKQAQAQGKQITVLATETRPLMQGARLTAWELKQAAIPFTLITDSMAGHFISRGEVNCVITGADCIAANGDTANKIGTYTLAVLAKEQGIPFYMVAPTTTIDRSLASGSDIPIEQRPGDEVTHINGLMVAPEGTVAANPAFDVTPHHLITAIITDRGIVREPHEQGLEKLFQIESQRIK